MNMTNETTTTPSVACPFANTMIMIDIYASAIASVVGIVTNTLCVIVFAMIGGRERNCGNMFKYLLLKALHDDLQFIFQVFSPLYLCQTCSSYLSYSIQVWYIWFYTYLESVNELCSGLFEIAATLDCLLLINRKMLWYQSRLSFILVITSLTLYSFILYIYRLFEYEIVKLPSSMTGAQRDFYIYSYTAFAQTDLYKMFRIAHGLVRDVICLVLFFIFNFIILITVRSRMSDKRKLNQLPRNPLTLSQLHHHSFVLAANIEKSERTEVKAAAMVVVVGVNYFFGHFIPLVYYCFMWKPSVFRTCLAQIGLLPFYISYVTPFFIYAAFNRTFRNHLKKLFRKLSGFLDWLE